MKSSTFRRVESGHIGLTPESVNLHEVVSECLDIIDPQARERGVDIGLDDSFDYAVLADHLRLKQVILNLLSNAISTTAATATSPSSAKCGATR